MPHSPDDAPAEYAPSKGCAVCGDPDADQTRDGTLYCQHHLQEKVAREAVW